MHIEQFLLDRIVDTLVRLAHPERIIVFGSAATGAASEDSDLDILVLESEPGNPRTESIRLRRALGFVPMPVDLIVMPTQRFEETKGVIGGLAYPANKYGRVVYDAA